MFRRLLVPTDLGESTRRALDFAITLAAPCAACVSLLHVVKRIPTLDAPEPALDGHDLRAFYDRLEGVARRRLRKLTANSTAPHGTVEVVHHVTVGQRADEIARFAYDTGSDLIILYHPTAHGRGPGSLSYRISARVQCPVLLIKS